MRSFIAYVLMAFFVFASPASSVVVYGPSDHPDGGAPTALAIRDQSLFSTGSWPTVGQCLSLNDASTVGSGCSTGGMPIHYNAMLPYPGNVYVTAFGCTHYEQFVDAASHIEISLGYKGGAGDAAIAYFGSIRMNTTTNAARWVMADGLLKAVNQYAAITAGHLVWVVTAINEGAGEPASMRFICTAW